MACNLTARHNFYLAGDMNKFFSFASILMLISGCSTDNSQKVNVTVQQGELAGVTDSATGIHSFKGIPFAQPPVDQLRWRPPQPVDAWQNTRDASQFADQCMQLPLYDDMRFRSSGVSEDCLYLNVWTPQVEADSALPVLVYFYGGGFTAGDGSERRYDGASMASQGVVTVTVNYRLGVFGLLSHPELSKESDYQGSGNYTFMDQQAALEWVSRNIQQFGGDPKRVTIGGESAGSLSVSMLMASAKSQGLFSAAIGQSGSILGLGYTAKPLEIAETQGQNALAQIAPKLGVKANPDSFLSEFRKVPAEKLLNELANNNLTNFDVTIDGRFISSAPEEIYTSGKFIKVPLLAGVNSQEGSYQSILKDNLPNVEQYQQAVKQRYPEDFDQVLALYPATNSEEVKDAAQALASDRFISYSTWNWADIVSRNPQSPVYYYRYEHIRPARKKSEGGSGEHNDRGAVHSAEIEYALGNLDVNPLFHWQPDDYAVSTMLQSYFVNFIKQHNPNAEGLPKWPKFDTNQMLIIDKSPRTEDMDTPRSRYQFHRNKGGL